MKTTRTPARRLLTVLVATFLVAGCGPGGASTQEATDRAEARAARTVGAYAPVNGLDLYYEIHGVGRPLVLLHGGGSTITTSFGRVLPALAATRQVIAVELQGHGHTADIERPLSFEQDADDVAALLRHVGIDRADFYGYSNGGNTALQIAIRHPSLVRRLVVAAGFFDDDGLDPEIRASFQRPATPADMPAELREAYEEVAPHPEHLPALVTKLVTRMRDFEGWPRDDLRSIDAPTLILIGDADVVRPEHAVEMFRLIPHAQLAVLPGTDHMTLVKRADLLLPIIPAFLDAPTSSAE